MGGKQRRANYMQEECEFRDVVAVQRYEEGLVFP